MSLTWHKGGQKLVNAYGVTAAFSSIDLKVADMDKF